MFSQSSWPFDIFFLFCFLVGVLQILKPPWRVALMIVNVTIPEEREHYVHHMHDFMSAIFHIQGQSS